MRVDDYLPYNEIATSDLILGGHLEQVTLPKPTGKADLLGSKKPLAGQHFTDEPVQKRIIR